MYGVVCRRLQGLQHQQQQVQHQKQSSEHHPCSRQVGGVSAGEAWLGDRDVSDSDDDEGAEICVVDDDEMTATGNNNNCHNDDNNDDNRRRAGVASAATSFHAYKQPVSPSPSPANIYPTHKLPGLYYYAVVSYYSHRYSQGGPDTVT